MTAVEVGVDAAEVSSFWSAPRVLAGVPQLSYLSACLVAACVAAAGAGAARAVWPAAGLVAICLAITLATSAPYERARSLRPVHRLVVVAGGVLVLTSSVADLRPAEARWAGAVVLSAAATFAAVIALARVARGPRAVLLVGGQAGVGHLAAQWAASRDVEVRGICVPRPDDLPAREIGLVPVLGSLDDVAAVASALGVDAVVVASDPLVSGPDVRRLSWALEGTSIELCLAPEVDGVSPRRVTPRVVGRRLMMSVTPGRRTRPEQWVKGVVDRVGAAILLVLFAPAWLVIAIIIKRDSQGPALFRQTRVGLDGQPFTILKFRTMCVDAEERLSDLRELDEGAGPLFKMAADPRMTGVGRTLRRTSVDEMPQLVNVLKGEMSLIGPRPGLPVETALYDAWVGRRLRAKPGMTGAWQVGGRSNLSWTESVRLDIDYVDNATLRDDVRIALRTARVVINRDGAV